MSELKTDPAPAPTLTEVRDELVALLHDVHLTLNHLTGLVRSVSNDQTSLRHEVMETAEVAETNRRALIRAAQTSLSLLAEGANGAGSL